MYQVYAVYIADLKELTFESCCQRGCRRQMAGVSSMSVCCDEPSACIGSIVYVYSRYCMCVEGSIYMCVVGIFSCVVHVDILSILHLYSRYSICIACSMYIYNRCCIYI